MKIIKRILLANDFNKEASGKLKRTLTTSGSGLKLNDKARAASGRSAIGTCQQHNRSLFNNSQISSFLRHFSLLELANVGVRHEQC